MSVSWFFTDWMDIWRVIVLGVCSYIGLILLLRVSGKRTLAAMNAFDFVVTVAFGSTIATIILSKDVSLAQGLTAFATLIVLQFCVTWLSVRSKTVAHMVKSAPTLIFYQGEFLVDALRQQRVTESEVRQAIREKSNRDMSSVSAIVMETSGKFSVITKNEEEQDGRSSLQDVTIPPR